jgi:hypothetical protein
MHVDDVIEEVGQRRPNHAGALGRLHRVAEKAALTQTTREHVSEAQLGNVDAQPTAQHLGVKHHVFNGVVALSGPRRYRRPS